MTGVRGLARRARRATLAQRRRWARRRVVTVALPGGGTLRWRADDRYPDAMATRDYERDLVALLAGSLGAGDRFLDLGANSGYLSFVARDLVGADGRVVAVEPRPDNLATLRDRASLNPHLPVEVVAAAVAPRSGPVTLHLTENLANARIEGGGWSHEKPAVGTIEVAGEAFDDLLAEVRPHVVKMDVEGAEGAVLSASGGPASWPGRPVLLVEYHGEDNRATCRALGDRWGYGCEERAPDGPLPAGLLVLRRPR